MSTNSKVAVVQKIPKSKENKMKITASKLIRWAGLAAMLAGILYIVIQLIHPPDNLTSITTGAMATSSYLTIAMSLFGLIGIGGIYARQVEAAGWLGLVGFLLLSLFWIATTAFNFAEALILPLLTNDAPQHVEGILGIFGGSASEVNLGVLPVVAPIAAGLYILGGLLLGIATLRSDTLPRWGGGMLILGALAPLASSLLGHPTDRILAVPMGIALIWLGYALFFERREKSS